MALQEVRTWSFGGWRLLSCRRSAACTDNCSPLAAGNFRDKIRAGDIEKISISEQITIRQDKSSQSHTAGFEVRRTPSQLCTAAA